jgi:hypothetical protein
MLILKFVGVVCLAALVTACGGGGAMRVNLVSLEARHHAQADGAKQTAYQRYLRDGKLHKCLERARSEKERESCGYE